MPNQNRYLKTEYPQGINTTYVQLLASYLVDRFSIKPDTALLDIGAGRGEYIAAFKSLGINAQRTLTDLERDWAKFRRRKYNVIFCKSVLEHIFNTQRFLKNARQMLEEGGLAIFLVPDWNSQWKFFYDDSTHVRPFTMKGLKQAMSLAGFQNVQCEDFIQLPFTWRHKRLRWLPYLVRRLPDAMKYRNGKQSVLIRFSKEKMLLCSATK